MELKKHSFLALLDESSASVLANAAATLAFKNDAQIFQEGAAADSLYLVLKGVVRLTKRDPDGKEQMLAFVKENDFFGEFGLLDGQPRSATAVAAEDDTLLARIPAEAFFSVFDVAHDRGLARLVLQIIRKVRQSNERYVEERLRKERLALIGQMANSILHDLKNPFSVFQMALYMLRQSDDASNRKYCCDMLEKQLFRMENMAEEILEFARGKTELSLEEFDLATFFKNVADLYTLHAEAGIQLAIPQASQLIVADMRKLTRVLQNILDNAIDAFQGQPGNIQITCSLADEQYTIRVQDNGPGIPLDIQPYIFEPFGRSGKHKGHGLGLAVSKAIMEAHGGAMRFETEPGQGTTFILTLPRKRG